MTHRGLLFGMLAMGFGPGHAQAPMPVAGVSAVQPLRSLPHDAFKPGEKLTYVVHYGLMDAGEAVLELQESDLRMVDRPTLHAKGTGRSLGAFNLFYKVDDRYDTWFDRDGVFPWLFKRSVNEGGYTFNQDYVYLQNLQLVTTQKRQAHPVPLHVQDMLSAFYYARTMDLTDVTPGQEFAIPCFLDDQLWPLRMRFIGRETVKVRNGRYRCLRFQPVVQEGRIFATNDDLNVWVTDDGNKVPVLAQAKVLVGSIKMELKAYDGLAHPIAKVK